MNSPFETFLRTYPHGKPITTKQVADRLHISVFAANGMLQQAAEAGRIHSVDPVTWVIND